MPSEILISYPWSDPQKLAEDSRGSVWFGRDGGRRWDTVISTGHRGMTGNVLLTLEPPAVQPWCFQSWYRDLFDGVISFAGPWLPHVVPLRRYPLPLLWPELPAVVDRAPWQDRIDGVVAVMGHKGSSHPDSLYELRIDTVRRMHAAGVRVDVYGRPGFPGEPWYRGELVGDAHEKRRVLSRYRYCLCVENCRAENYVSEKLPEALLAGCFPIYRGPDNILDYPFPHDLITDPDDVEHMRFDESDHQTLLDQVDPGAIAEELCQKPLFESILSLCT